MSGRCCCSRCLHRRLAFGLMPLFSTMAPLMAVAFLLGLGLGSAQPNVMSLLHDRAPRGRVGEALGLRTTIMNSSHVVLPLVIGAFGSVLGAAAGFWLMAAALIGGGWSARQRLRVERHAARRGMNSDSGLPHRLSYEELEVALEGFLAGWDGTQPLWVFGYGSLIWKPDLSFDLRSPARVHGYHRRLCLWSRINRGTPQCPGLVAGLDRGGSCAGVVYRVPAVAVAQPVFAALAARNDDQLLRAARVSSADSATAPSSMRSPSSSGATHRTTPGALMSSASSTCSRAAAAAATARASTTSSTRSARCVRTASLTRIWSAWRGAPESIQPRGAVAASA